MLKIDVRASRELQAAILAMKAADRDLRKELYAAARKGLGGRWVPALEARSRTKQDRAVIIKGARVRVGTDGFRLIAASSNRPLSGGLIPTWYWHAVEFGARNVRSTFNTRSRNGNAYTVTKTINRGLPGRVHDGRIAFDAASEIGTRLVGEWVRIIVITYREAADRRG